MLKLMDNRSVFNAALRQMNKKERFHFNTLAAKCRLIRLPFPKRTVSALLRRAEANGQVRRVGPMDYQLTNTAYVHDGIDNVREESVAENGREKNGNSGHIGTMPQVSNNNDARATQYAKRTPPSPPTTDTDLDKTVRMKMAELERENQILRFALSELSCELKESIEGLLAQLQIIRASLLIRSSDINWEILREQFERNVQQEAPIVEPERIEWDQERTVLLNIAAHMQAQAESLMTEHRSMSDCLHSIRSLLSSCPRFPPMNP